VNPTLHRTSSSRLFHHSLNSAEAGQSSHHQLLSGHVPAFVEVPLSKAATATISYTQNQTFQAVPSHLSG
jgi:hypothetical protein